MVNENGELALNEKQTVEYFKNLPQDEKEEEIYKLLYKTYSIAKRNEKSIADTKGFFKSGKHAVATIIASVTALCGLIIALSKAMAVLRFI